VLVRDYDIPNAYQPELQNWKMGSALIMEKLMLSFNMDCSIQGIAIKWNYQWYSLLYSLGKMQNSSKLKYNGKFPEY
jgi:hypothetical protein